MGKTFYDMAFYFIKHLAAYNIPLRTNAITPGIACAIPKSHALVLAATRWA